MVAAVPIAFLLAGAAYLVLARSWSLLTAAAALFFCRIGGSTLWVFSTILLQQTAEDRFMGRVFAAEGAFCTLTMAISGFAVGWALDEGMTAFTASAVMGALSLGAGAAWSLGLWRAGRRAAAERASAAIAARDPADPEAGT
jgi:hypothetical protein